MTTKQIDTLQHTDSPVVTDADVENYNLRCDNARLQDTLNYIKQDVSLHVDAINMLVLRINSMGYSARGNLLMLDPDWSELKEHLSELRRGV